MKLYEIREKALESGRAVFSVQQLATLINTSKDVAKTYAYRLVKQGLAKRLTWGKISFVDDSLIIATQLLEPAYISCYSALLFHNLITQIPRYVEAVTTKRSIFYPEFGIRYYKLKANLFYGYKRCKKGKSYVFVADPEKAIIDGLYLNILPTNLINELDGVLDKEKLSLYIHKFKGKGKKKLERLLL